MGAQPSIVFNHATYDYCLLHYGSSVAEFWSCLPYSSIIQKNGQGEEGGRPGSALCYTELPDSNWMVVAIVFMYLFVVVSLSSVLIMCKYRRVRQYWEKEKAYTQTQQILLDIEKYKETKHKEIDNMFNRWLIENEGTQVDSGCCWYKHRVFFKPTNTQERQFYESVIEDSSHSEHFRQQPSHEEMMTMQLIHATAPLQIQPPRYGNPIMMALQ